MSRRIISYFCIVTLAIFQLSVFVQPANCCCVTTNHDEAAAAKSGQKEHSCCAMNDSEPVETQNGLETTGCHTTSNLCACEHRTNPGKVDEPLKVLTSRSDVKDQVISIRLLPVFSVDETYTVELFNFRQQVVNQPIITCLQTVVLRN